MLLEHGAELDAPAMSGGTPLTRAIESSREQVVEFLITKGAKVQTENKKGRALRYSTFVFFFLSSKQQVQSKIYRSDFRDCL